MKYGISYLFCLYIVFFGQSCDSRIHSGSDAEHTEAIDSFESALPHGTALPSTELSDEDRLKLAKAIGKSAKLISLDSLQNIIKNDSSGWCLYQFWNLDCLDCLKINESLKTLTSPPEQLNIKVKYINTRGLYPEQVNEYIREKGIAEEVFTVSTDTLDNWTYKIDSSWDGNLPAFLLVNHLDGTKLFYQQEFSKDELQAILETLTL